MSNRYAFATLVTSDHYLPGALALAAALREVHLSPPTSPDVPFDIVCIATPETVDVNTIKLLRRAFDVVVGVEVIEEKNEAGLKLLGRPDLNAVLTKLHVFRLTQYEKVIFLDADVLPIRPLSHLFSLPHEFSAVPDVGWPDIFNSGVMVLTPGEDKFNDIMNLVRTRGSWDGGDQGLLNEWRGSDWNRLSFIYNTTPTAAYTYAPAYERFGSQISAIHFIGPDKPWKDLPYRAPSSSSQKRGGVTEGLTRAPDAAIVPQRTYAYGALVDRWFDVYDRHYRQAAPEQEFREKRYENVWDEAAWQSQQESQSQAPSRAPLGLEELKQMALEGGSSAAKYEGEGQYRSLPLEGRIDLMRPRKEEAPVEEKAGDQAHPEQPTIGQQPTGERHEEWRGQEILQPLPTPAPSEVPPSPYLGPVSLPPSSVATPGPQEGPSQPTHEAPYQPPPGAPSQEHRDSAVTPRLEDFQHLQKEAPQQPQQQPQEQYHEPPPPPRPPSPPLVRWNPAIEPPPTEAPPVTAFPADAYFPNAWDLPPSTGKLHQDLTGQPVPDSTAFFQALPPSKIPERLIQEGYYSNVIGPHQPQPEHRHDDSQQHQPTYHPPPPPPSHEPDISRVHKIFPWEEKPIHRPGRVFPEGESATPPGVRYIEDMPPAPEPEPEPEPEPVATAPAPAPEAKHGALGLRIPIPPPQIYPGPKGYYNAWDAVPSIQRYASRLVKPPPPPPPVQPPVIWGHRRRSDSYRSRGELSDANSMDGDVEDEVDDEEEEVKEKEEKEKEKEKEVEDGRSVTSDVAKGKKPEVKSPPLAAGPSTRPKPAKREYRSIGVQTVPKDVRSVGIQVSEPTPSLPVGKGTDEPPRRPKRGGAKPHSRHGSGTSSPSTSTQPDLPKPVTTLQEVKQGQEQLAAVSPSIANVQSFIRPPTVQTQQNVPSGAVSPRLHDTFSYESRTPPPGTPAPTTPAATARPPSRPPAITTSPPMVVMRTPSTETADSTIGPLSPTDSPVMGSRKPGRRTWNPATGVDVFKRTSEEVLARFLRMGSWDDESAPTHRV